MAGEKCSGHDDLVARAAMGTAMFEEHTRQLSGIFEILTEIRKTVDQNQVRAQSRDLALAEVSECILKVDRKIENGLRSEIREISMTVKNLLGIMDKRRVDRVEQVGNSRRGVRGFLRPGWREFKNKASFIAVTTTILFVVWLIIWGESKLAIFHEGPVGLLKLFGIG